MVEFKNAHPFHFYERYLNHYQLIFPDISCYNSDLIFYVDYDNNFKKDYKLRYMLNKDEIW